MSILQDLQSIPVIDNHSHVGMGEWRSRVPFVPIEGQYRSMAMGDVHSALSPEELSTFLSALQSHDASRPVALAPDLARDARTDLARYIEGRARSAYSRNFEDACHDLYGQKSLPDALLAANHLRAEIGIAGVWDRSLEGSNTRVIFGDTPWLDPEVYSPLRYRWIARLDPFVFPFVADETSSRGGQVDLILRDFRDLLAEYLRKLGHDEMPHDLGSYCEFVDGALDEYKSLGAVSFKVIAAYLRPLHFGPCDFASAKTLYAEALAGQAADLTRLQDYLMRHVLRASARLNIPVQFHLGFGGPLPGLRVLEANPLLLEGLISDPTLRDVRFVLLHGAYPYTSEIACLANNYANAYLDFSWLSLLFKGKLSDWLFEWLEFVPEWKLLFGSDTSNPEMQYIAVKSARHALGKALDHGMELGLWTSSGAMRLAERALHNNASDLYEL